jgi:hypothetical protein
VFREEKRRKKKKKGVRLGFLAVAACRLVRSYTTQCIWPNKAKAGKNLT